jgi:hypothetical protein
MRDRWGIVSRAGMAAFERKGTEVIGDWPGIWLTGAVIAASAMIAFALFFPPDEKQPLAQPAGSPE